MSSENKYILRKASHVAACDCCLCSTNGSANKCDCQRKKKKKKKGAERDISFYMKINKCSFWIYKHGFGPTLNYLQSTSSSFTLQVVSNFSV